MKATEKLITTYDAVPEFDTPRYLLGDVAAAADISTGTLKAWISREPRSNRKQIVTEINNA